MIEINFTQDVDYVKSVFTHPEIWKWISDDYSGPISEFNPPLVEGYFYLIPSLNGVKLGAFMLVQVGTVACEVHSAILPEYQHEHTGEIFQAILKFVGKNIPRCKRIRTWVPAWNEPCLIAARRHGFEECGKETKANYKFGVSHDLYLFGVNV